MSSTSLSLYNISSFLTSCTRLACFSQAHASRLKHFDFLRVNVQCSARRCVAECVPEVPIDSPPHVHDVPIDSRPLVHSQSVEREY